MGKNQWIAIAVIGAVLALSAGAYLIAGGGDDDAATVGATGASGAFGGGPGLLTAKEERELAVERSRKARREFRKKQRESRRIHEKAKRVKERNLAKIKQKAKPFQDYNKAVILEAGDVTRIERPFRGAVALAVKSPKDDVIYVHGYNLRAPVKAGEYGHLTFDASMPGTYTIELEKANEKIAVLVVEKE